MLEIQAQVSGAAGVQALQGSITGLSAAVTGLNSGIQIVQQVTGAVQGMVSGMRAWADEANKAATDTKVFELTLARFAVRTDEAGAVAERLAAKFGLSVQDVQGSMTTLIRAGFRDMGQLEKVMEGAAASSIAFGRTAAEGFDRVGDAAVTGLSAALNSIGVSENLGPALDKYAKSVGKTADALNEQERAQVLANLVLKATGTEVEALSSIQNEYVRSQQQSDLAAQQFRKELGELFMPVVMRANQAMAQATGTVLDLVKAFKAGTDPLDALALRFPQLASGIVAVRPVIEAVKRAFADMGAATLPLAERLAPVFERAASAIRPMLERLGVVMRDLGSIAQEAFHRVIIPVIEAVAPVVARVIERAAPLIASLGEGFRDVARMVVTAWENVLLPVIQALAPVVTRAVDAAANALASVIQAVRNVVQALTAIFNGDWSKAWELLKNAVGQGVLAVQEALKGIVSTLGDVITGIGRKLDEKADELWTKFLKFGTDLGEKIREGIIKGLGSVRDIIIGALANKVDDAVLDETWATATPEGKKRLRQNFPDYVPPEERGGGSVPPLKTPVGSADVYGPQTPFDAVFKIILQKEGGFQNDPGDAGNYANGKLVGTKYGISARSYPDLDIKNLTVAQAREIYYRDYWKKSGAESITDPALALVHMDTAINSGTGTASRFLKMSGGDWEKYLDQRFAWMKTLDDWDRFGVGWTNRIAAIREQARGLSGGGLNLGGYHIETVAKGEHDPQIRVANSVDPDKWRADFLTSLLSGPMKDAFLSDPKVKSDCAIIAARIMGELGVQLEGAANDRINAGKLVQQFIAHGGQKIGNEAQQAQGATGDLVHFQGPGFGAGKSGNHVGVIVGVTPDGKAMVIQNPGSGPTEIVSLDSVLEAQRRQGNKASATIYRAPESPYAQGQSGQATAQDTANQAKATDQLIGKLNEAREAYGKNKLTLEQYRKVLGDVNAEAQKGFNASKGTERKAYENIARVAKEALAAVAPKAGADLSAETIRRAMELTAALEKAQAARDKDPKNTGLVQAYARAKGELDAFRKSSADAALALDSIGKSSTKTSGQVIATAAQLKKEGGDALRLFKDLEAAQKGGNAAQIAAAQTAVNTWIGESKVRKSVYDLEVQAYQTRLKNREADTQHHQRAAAAYQSVQSAVRAGDVKRAQASLDDLKSDQQTRLAVEGKTAADRERIARETNGRILSATYLLNAKIKEQADVEAQAWRKGAEAKALGTKAADAELARRLAENRETEKRANLQAQRDQQAVLRDFGKARADEEKQLAAELAGLKIDAAKETASRLKLIEDAELEAFKGSQEERLALVRRYSQAQYDRAVALAEATRKQAVRDAAGKPNEAAIVEAARQTYLTAVEAARQTRLGVVRAAQEALSQAVEQANRDTDAALANLDKLLEGSSEAAKAAVAALPDTQKNFDDLLASMTALSGDLAQPGVADAWTESITDMGKSGQLTADQVRKLLAELRGLVDLRNELEQIDSNLLDSGAASVDVNTGEMVFRSNDDVLGRTPGSGDGGGDSFNLDTVDLDQFATVEELQAVLDVSKLTADEQQILRERFLATLPALDDLIDRYDEFGNAVYKTDEQLRGIGVTTQETADDFFDLDNAIQNVLTLPWEEVLVLVTAAGLKPEQIEKITAAWKAFHAEGEKIAALDLLSAGPLQEAQAVLDSLAAGAITSEAARTALEGLRQELDGIEGNEGAVKAIDEVIGGLGSLAEVGKEVARAAGQQERPFQNLIDRLEEMRKKPGAAVAEIDKLIAKLRELQGKEEGLAKFNEYAGYVQKLAGAFGSLAESVGNDDLGANLSGLANLAGKAITLAGQIAKGDYVGAVVNVVSTIADAFTGFRRAYDEADKARKSFQDGFRLIDASAFSSFGVRSRGFLADLFGGGPEVVKNINQMVANIAQTLESGVSGAFSSGIKKFLNGEGDMLSALRDGIKGAVIDAVTQAVIQGAVIKGALGQMLTDLTLAADAQNWGRVGEITGQIGGALPGIVTNLQTALGPLVGTLNAALGSNTAAVNGNTQALKEAQFQSTTIIQQGSAGTGGRLARRLAGAI